MSEQPNTAPAKDDKEHFQECIDRLLEIVAEHPEHGLEGWNETEPVIAPTAEADLPQTGQAPMPSTPPLPLTDGSNNADAAIAELRELLAQIPRSALHGRPRLKALQLHLATQQSFGPGASAESLSGPLATARSIAASLRQFQEPSGAETPVATSISPAATALQTLPLADERATHQIPPTALPPFDPSSSSDSATAA